MKRLFVIFLILLVGVPSRLSANNAYKLEPELYVFLDAEFSRITLNDGAPIGEGRGEVFAAPATLSFDGHVLKLAGGERIWGEAGKNAPIEFSPVRVPALVVGLRQRAAVLSAMSVQYLEKAPDGSLWTRQLERDSPDAPHYRLTFQTNLENGAEHPTVTCRLEAATVSGREKIPGVELDAGKPILTRFEEDFQLPAKPGVWSGYVLRRPKGGDYGLLLLLKVTPQPGAAVSVSDAMTAAELDFFITNYYRRPEPELVSVAIKAMDAHRVLDPSQYRPRHSQPVYSGLSDDTPVLHAPESIPKRNFWVYVGFLAEVIAAHPERVAEWEKIARKGWLTRDCFRAALKFRTPGALLALKEPHIYRPSAILRFGNSWGNTDSALWGAFYASGNPAYVSKLIARMSDVYSPNRDEHSIGAMWSLAYHFPQHPVVRTTLEAAREGATPSLRKAINDVLSLNLAVVQRELDSKIPLNHRAQSVQGIMGLREMDFGPVNPGQEMHPK